MPKLVKLMEENKLTLMVELVGNDLELAEAAIAAGADALQLELEIPKLGSLKQEIEKINAIVRKSKIPIGGKITKGTELAPKDIQEIGKMGFDFINLDLSHFTPEIIGIKGISRILSLTSRYSMDDLIDIHNKNIAALDAAIIPVAERGKNLVVGDLQQYISIVISSGIPVIIPTHRAIKPSEVAIISDTGARGLLLTSVVTGKTAKHIAKAVGEYRLAVDDVAS